MAYNQKVIKTTKARWKVNGRGKDFCSLFFYSKMTQLEQYVKWQPIEGSNFTAANGLQRNGSSPSKWNRCWIRTWGSKLYHRLERGAQFWFTFLLLNIWYKWKCFSYYILVELAIDFKRFFSTIFLYPFCFGAQNWEKLSVFDLFSIAFYNTIQLKKSSDWKKNYSVSAVELTYK